MKWKCNYCSVPCVLTIDFEVDKSEWPDRCVCGAMDHYANWVRED
jgi:hypothetical protein